MVLDLNKYKKIPVDEYTFDGYTHLGGKSYMRGIKKILHRRVFEQNGTLEQFIDTVEKGVLAYDVPTRQLLYRDENNKIWVAEFRKLDDCIPTVDVMVK